MGGAAGAAVPEAPVTVNQTEFVVIDAAFTFTAKASAAKFGTVTVIAVEDQFVTEPEELPNLTVPPFWVDPKFAPLMTMDSPTGPAYGEIELTLGSTVKGSALL